MYRRNRRYRETCHEKMLKHHQLNQTGKDRKPVFISVFLLMWRSWRIFGKDALKLQFDDNYQWVCLQMTSDTQKLISAASKAPFNLYLSKEDSPTQEQGGKRVDSCYQ